MEKFKETVRNFKDNDKFIINPSKKIIGLYYAICGIKRCSFSCDEFSYDTLEEFCEKNNFKYSVLEKAKGEEIVRVVIEIEER